MTSTYSAPFNIGARPFKAGGTFPGAPGFGGPSGINSIPGLSFPIGNGPQPGGSGINGFAPSVFRDNRVVDWGTNGQVAYHLVVTPDRKSEISENRLREVGIGMLCFARDMKLDVFTGNVNSAMKPDYGPLGRTERTVEAFELTTLNEYLRMRDNSRGCISEILHSAQQVKEAFPFLGVVLTEVAPANDGNYGNRPSTRVINFVVRGRCNTFNFWSGKRPAGTAVWFIIKKIEFENRLVWAYVPYPRAGAPAAPTKGYDHCDNYPPPEEMCWEEKDEEGNVSVRMGEAVFVGSMGNNVGDIALDPDRQMWKQGLFKTGNHTMPPTTEIFVRI